MTAPRTAPSAEAVNRAAILAELDRLGGLTTQAEALTFEGDRVILPESMNGSVDAAIRFLEEFQASQETEYSYSRTFPYRPEDGAAAFDRAVTRVTGSAGIGRTVFSFFGDTPPMMRTVKTGHREHDTIQVPWGRVEVPMLNATFDLDGGRTPDGYVFAIEVTAKRKSKTRVAAFLDVVADELAQRSIYRGKAVTGSDRDHSEPVFLDLSTVDPGRVVYAADAMVQLQANLWTLIERPDTMRELGIPLKRAVLVEGPYGTGKTLAGALTGQRAIANGWTYILCRPGQDDLTSTMNTARMYAPSVVWVEDIDTTAGSTASYLSKLLETFDGVTAKGHEVIAGFTSNHPERIPKGMLRPGRIDTVIHVGPLDDAGIRRLVEISTPDHLLASDIDWPKVCTAFTGYVPAYGTEAIGRALRYALSRNGGTVAQISTEDLVNAAQGLRSQLALMDGADEGVHRREGLDGVFSAIMVEAAEDVLKRGVLKARGGERLSVVDD